MKKNHIVLSLKETDEQYSLSISGSLPEMILEEIIRELETIEEELEVNKCEKK